MKNLILAALLFTSLATMAQQGQDHQDSSQHRIIKTDGTELVVTILQRNEKELRVLTQDHRIIVIPQYVIRTIEPIQESTTNEHDSDPYGTRYFINANAIPMHKGERYIQWNIYGPDVRFGLSNGISVGATTTWFGGPIIGNIQKSFRLNANNHLAFGIQAGSGAWVEPQAAGIAPFATWTLGNKKSNLSLTGGYGLLKGPYARSQRWIGNISGMTAINSKFSLVFDSFIVFDGKDQYKNQEYNTFTPLAPGFALIAPGVRWHQSEGKALQFGLAGVVTQEGVFPYPIPMIQWYRRL